MPTEKTNTTANITENTVSTNTTGMPPEVGANDVNTELTVNDLAAIKSIIDIASQRGAFRPPEMVAIGTIYNKLDKFLTAIQKAQTPNA